LEKPEKFFSARKRSRGTFFYVIRHVNRRIFRGAVICPGPGFGRAIADRRVAGAREECRNILRGVDQERRGAGETVTGPGIAWGMGHGIERPDEA